MKTKENEGVLHSSCEHCFTCFRLLVGRSSHGAEDDTHIMVLGSIRPLVDAMRIAYVELIEWLVADYGFDKMEAFQVVSQVGEVRVANIVDPNDTVVAKFPKKLLPPKR